MSLSVPLISNNLTLEKIPTKRSKLFFKVILVNFTKKFLLHVDDTDKILKLVVVFIKSCGPPGKSYQFESLEADDDFRRNIVEGEKFAVFLDIFFIVF